MAQSNELESSNILPTEVAFAALLPEIEAVPDDELEPLNVEVVGAVTLVLGVLPELRALRAQIANEMPRFDLERFDRLEQYALALSHAHTLHRTTLPTRVNVAELANELVEVRDQLFAAALALASYRLVDGARLRACKKTTGYRATAMDVLTLVAVYKETWPELEGKTPVTRVSLLEAGNKAVNLLTAIGLREQAPLATRETARLRRKAFTLFNRAYDDARRAVAYLRAPIGDADRIAPSFFAARGGKRRAPEGDALEASNPPSEPPAPGVEPTAGLDVDNSAGLPVTPPFIEG